MPADNTPTHDQAPFALPIKAPVAWQNFGDWCLTGQHGMRPIYLAVVRDPRKPAYLAVYEEARLVPLTPEHPVAKQIVDSVNQHAHLTAENTRLRAALINAMEFFEESARCSTIPELYAAQAVKCRQALNPESK